MLIDLPILDPLLEDLHDWDRQSAESRCRTSIELILFERLSAHQQEPAARNLSLTAERPVIARTITGDVVTGDVDYVLGYEAEYPEPLKEQMESTLVVVEAKKVPTFESGLAQCTSYLGTAPNSQFIFGN